MSDEISAPKLPAVKTPPPPEHLRTDGPGVRYWSKVLDSYALGVDEMRILEDACLTLDLVDKLDRELAKRKTPYVKGSMGQQKINPAYGEVRRQRETLARLLKMLRLPAEIDDVGAGRENPRGHETSTNARAAAIKSWGR